MCSVVQKLPWNSTEIKNCSETWCQQRGRYKTHVVVVKKSHYLLKELLVMVRQQTSKRNAAQIEAFQAAFGGEDIVADTLAHR